MTDRPSDRAIAWMSTPGGQVADLITRLQRLSGPNPVARVILLPEDWPEIERLLKSAVELAQGDEK